MVNTDGRALVPTARDGYVVGIADGDGVGAQRGCLVVGCLLGDTEGRAVASIEGVMLGSVVGYTLGDTLGNTVGFVEG